MCYGLKSLLGLSISKTVYILNIKTIWCCFCRVSSDWGSPPYSKWGDRVAVFAGPELLFSSSVVKNIIKSINRIDLKLRVIVHAKTTPEWSNPENWPIRELTSVHGPTRLERRLRYPASLFFHFSPSPLFLSFGRSRTRIIIYDIRPDPPTRHNLLQLSAPTSRRRPLQLSPVSLPYALTITGDERMFEKSPILFGDCLN